MQNTRIESKSHTHGLVWLLVRQVQQGPVPGPSRATFSFSRKPPAPTPPPKAAAVQQKHCRRRCKTAAPPEQRLRVRQLRCRPPPTTPPVPSAHAAALPFLLARHPKLPLVQPSSKYRPPATHGARGSSPLSSLVSSPPQHAREEDADGSAETGDGSGDSSDELDAVWRDVFPTVGDMPHLASSDTEFGDDGERRFRRGRDPSHWPVASFEPNPLLRVFSAPTQRRMVPMAYRPEMPMLPNPFDLTAMRRADAAAARSEAFSAAERSARKRRRDASPGKHEDPLAPARKLRPRMSRRRKEEADVLRRLHRYDAAALSDSDSDYLLSDSGDGRPTVGFVAVARRVLRGQREKVKRRRAAGRNPSESTDDSGSDVEMAPQ